MKNFIIFLCLIYILTSCGKIERSQVKDNFISQNLEGESYTIDDQTLSHIEGFKEVTLDCRLWVKVNEEIDEVNDRPVIKKWDIKNNFEFDKEIYLKARTQEFLVKYKVEIFDFIYHKRVDVFQEGKDREINNTIELYVNYTGKFYRNEIIFGYSDGYNERIYEGVGLSTHSLSYTQNNDERRYYEKLKCSLIIKK